MIGSIGEVTFVTSENFLRTFSSLKFSRQASYASHKILGRSELLEFTGNNAASCSLTVMFRAQDGLNPLNELTTLRDIMTGHQPVPFVLAGEVMGRGLWVVDSLNATIDVVDHDGFILEATANITMKEYLDEGI